MKTPRALGFRMPAEWEPHRATWLAWPHNLTDWPGKFAPIPWAFAELARALTRVERVRLLVASEAMELRARRYLQKAGAELTRIDFVRAATNRSWTRDFLPLAVVRATARGAELGAVKWRFDGWARYDDHRLDEAAGKSVAARFARRAWEPRVVLEGGAIEVDGEGTLMVTEECLLTGPYPRAAELGQAGVERAFSDYLGVDKVLWLPAGIAGDDTSGHTDDFVRFVAPGRVVLCRESNPRDPNHRTLEAAREHLEGVTDARGRHLEVIPLPMPAPLYFDGQRVPASYANFYLANELVLVPTFNDPSDRVALGTLAELFPERAVIGIHALDLVLGLGTLHCSTQQEPLPGYELPRRPDKKQSKPAR